MVPDDVHRLHCFSSLLPLMMPQDVQNSLVFSQGQGYKARKVVSAAGLSGLKHTNSDSENATQHILPKSKAKTAGQEATNTTA